MSTAPLPLKSKRLDQQICTVNGVFDAAAANLLSVFRGFALVPIPIGATQQEIRLTPMPLFAEAMSADHHQRLAVSSIAVALGVAGLLALLFDRQDHLMEFLGRNPALGKTLLTWHGRTFVIWIRTDVPRRLPISTSSFSLVTEGKIMVFDRAATAKPSYLLTVASPITVDLEAIDWGPDPDGQIAAWLVSLRHGEFFRRNRRGAIKANLQPWAAYLARRLQSTLRCNPGDGCLEHREGQNDQWTLIGNAAVLDRISELVRTAPIGPESAKASMDAKWMHSVLLPKLRAALYRDRPLVDEFVARFIQEAVRPEQRANFTLKEFYAAYEQLRQTRGWPGFSNWDLGKAVRRLMAGPPYLKRVSKSVHRENGSNDGFRGFAIRLPATLSVTGEIGVAAA